MPTNRCYVSKTDENKLNYGMRERFSAKAKRATSITGIILTSLALVLAAASLPVTAQSGVPAPDSTTLQAAPLGNMRPDVQIVVLGLPTGTYAVSSVYAKQVPKAVAQGRIDKLLALTKWQATSRKFSDAPAVPNPLRDDKTPKGNLSAASFETTAAIYAADGTIDWEPFLQAFGDVERINLICFTGTDFAYRGPVQFDTDRITFSASSGQGTVAAVANIKKPEPSPVSFGLPKYATADTVSVPVKNRVKENTDTNRVIRIVLVALAATGVALIIYAITSRLVTKP